MATLGATVLTLADWTKRNDPDGKTATVVELLAQSNEIVDDMLWKEGNLPVGEMVTVRTGLPTPAWRLLNGGVTPTKSTTAQITEQCAMLEDWVEVDKDLAELNGNTEAFRLSEAVAHIEGISQEFAATLFYGNSGVAPSEFTGLAPRYSSLSAANGQNIVRGGGSGSDNSSIWLIGWGQQTCYGIFPKGSKAGIMHENLGLQTVQTSTGIGTGRLRAYQDHWQWKCGIVLKDWRFVVRGCNIDISALTTESSNADLLKLMIRMIHRLPHMNGIKPIFYANRTVKEMLDIQASNKANVYLKSGEEEGKPKLSLRGIPIKTCDALTEAEATVT